MTPRDWLRSLAEPVLVVGNGPLPNRVPEGDYASVVRINNYELGAWSGFRVTHWVVSGYKDIQVRPVPVALIPWSVDHQTRRCRYDLDFAIRAKRRVVHLDSTSHITKWFVDALMRWKYFPSVGFCFLSWLNENKIKPDIAGFDGMRTGHFSDPTHHHGHAKTKRIEWILIQSRFIRKDLNL